MRKDSIVEELHEIRRQHAKQFGYDLHKIFADLKMQERKSGKKFTALPIKKNHAPGRPGL
jgi:hypothetical protein